MSDARDSRVLELRKLARQFYAKTEETDLQEYIDLMRNCAAELEGLADEIEARAQPPNQPLNLAHSA
jgi:hypothetical protein